MTCNFQLALLSQEMWSLAPRPHMFLRCIKLGDVLEAGKDAECPISACAALARLTASAIDIRGHACVTDALVSAVIQVH